MNGISGPEWEQCVRQARRGDERALGRLLEQYRAYLLFLARFQISQRLNGKVDASDIVQETFCEAGRDFGQFLGHSEDELTAWLRRILARNLADQARRFHGTQCRDVRLERRLADALDASSVALDRGLLARESSPSDKAARREQAVLVANALARLPAHYQEVLVLRHLKDLSCAEIARRQDKTVDSVKCLWARALAKLRQCFEESR